MEKAPEAFRTISEVADDLDLPQHVLRFWETRFQQIKPLKRGGGRRYYRPDDIDLLRGIRHLLYGEGYTIRGAQRILKDHGIKFVQSVWKPGATQPTTAAPRPEVPEAEPPELPLPAKPLAPSPRRADADSAHRRLFGLLPSFLSQGLDEERLARSRAADTEPAIRPQPSAPKEAEPEVTDATGAPTAPAAASSLSSDAVHRLQDTLRELRECRRLLDVAMGGS